MNIYEVTELIHELEKESPTPYNLKLINFYKGKRQELIKEINIKIQSISYEQ